MGDSQPLHTAIVEGPLAFAMRRLVAANAGDIGLQILRFSQLAARLAGGFVRPITAEILEPAIQAALHEKDFKEIERVRQLPGMTRAMARTLQKIWNADIDLDAMARTGAPRVQDLAAIERRVRDQLPAGVLLPRDLCAAALARVERAPELVGPVRIESISWIPPLWRRLFNALREVVPVAWAAPGIADHSWFSGPVERIELTNRIENCEIVSCADPHHEVVESLRWIRKLLSTKAAKPREIAIAAAAPAAWDEHFLGLAANAGVSAFIFFAWRALP